MVRFVLTIFPGACFKKNGFIVNGTGEKAFYGDLMIRGELIEEVTPKSIEFNGRTVDCKGMVVSPGFIDAHFHMDWTLPASGYPELSKLFAEQGITTFVAGNCGHGYQDIQILDAKHQELDKFNGMFLKDIAKEREMSQFYYFLDVTRKSNGRARVLNHRYSCLENILTMM